MKSDMHRPARLLSRITALVTAALALMAGSAFATDVAMVNMLAGDVAYQSTGVPSAKAVAFMKVRDGDRFTVAEGATVKVVYFDGGRQELWKGPAVFKAGAKGGEASSGKPDVTQLPAQVPGKMAQVPELVQIAKLGRAGGVTVRGVGTPKLTAAQQDEVNKAKKLYTQLSATAPSEDVTAELYLYSVLQEYLLYTDMKSVVETMRKKQPANLEIQELAAWVGSRAN